MKFLFTLLALIPGMAMNWVNAQADSFLVRSSPSFSVNSAAPVNTNSQNILFTCGARSSASREEPLLVIDGVPYEFNELRKLNPNDIESINILKEPALARIGCRPARGVILVTTKASSFRKFIIRDFLSGEKLPLATIYFTSGNDIIKLMANDSGVLYTDKLKPGVEYGITVSSAGYKSLSTTGKRKEQEILLERDMKLCDEVVVVGYPVITCSRTCAHTNTQITHCTYEAPADTVYTIRPGASKRSVLPNFSVYPNPVRRSNTLSISFNSEEEWTVQLAVFSLTGQQMSVQPQKISKGMNKLSVAVDPKWAAGIYNIQLRDEKGTLTRLEKIIVQ